MDGAPASSSALAMAKHKWDQRLQHLLDKSTPHTLQRWTALLLMLCLYIVRVWFIRGFYIVSYGLAIYNLNLLLGFITPQFDPETEDGPELPTKSNQEFKPFVRRLPEMKFWWASLKSISIAQVMTFFSVFDVPVFWPILLLYWLVLFCITMNRQISHMLKYNYVPFTTGKKKYGGKDSGKSAVKDNK